MILVDSCIYIVLMRQGVNPVKRLHARHAELVSCAIVHLEVLRGVVDPKIKAYLGEFFETVPQVPLSPSLMQSATELAWEQDRKGLVLPVTDVIIAACALHVSATVITTDRHFERVTDLRVAPGL